LIFFRNFAHAHARRAIQQAKALNTLSAVDPLQCPNNAWPVNGSSKSWAAAVNANKTVSNARMASGLVVSALITPITAVLKDKCLPPVAVRAVRSALALHNLLLPLSENQKNRLRFPPQGRKQTQAHPPRRFRSL
jgi:hypothetical protein